MLRRRLAIQHPVDHRSPGKTPAKTGFRNGRVTRCEFELRDGSRGILYERRVNADVVGQLGQLYGENLKEIRFLSRARIRNGSGRLVGSTRRRRREDQP